MMHLLEVFGAEVEVVDVAVVAGGYSSGLMTVWCINVSSLCFHCGGLAYE